MIAADRTCPRWLARAALAALAIYTFLAFYNSFLAQVEKDEGFYTLAFRLVAQGMLPYHDFYYLESPALPYYYAFLLKGPGITMLSVRLLSTLTGLAGLLVLVGCAARVAGRLGAALAALLLFSNAAQAEYFAIDVTYPLITLLLALAIAVELSSWPAARKMALQGILLVLAGAAKASIGLVAMIWLGGLLWKRRHDRRAVAWGALAFLATLLVSVGPLFFADPKAFIFDVISTPMQRGRLFAFMHKSDPLDQFLEFGWGQKIEALRTILLWHVPALVLAFLAWPGRPPKAVRRPGVLGEASVPITASLVVGALFHFLVPFPCYPNYLFLLLPTLTLVIALHYARSLDVSDRGPGAIRTLGLPVLLCALHLLSGVDLSKIGLEVGIWRNGPQGEMARVTAEAVPPDGWLFTDYLPLAIDANRRVVPGNEGGRHSVMPDLPDELAREFHVLNRKSYVQLLLSGRADAVALTQQLTEESIKSVPGFLEEIEAALQQRYDLVKEFPAGPYFRYGRMRIFKRRSPAADASRLESDPGTATVLLYP
jgi:hypothetical protein